MDWIIDEDSLTIITMTGRKIGGDFMDVLKEFVKKYCIPLSKLTSLCTDGCPPIVGAKNGLAALMKRESNFPNLLPIHCLLQQKTFAYQISNNKLKDEMNMVITL